ncbi:cadherin-like beta sandwich domain-containing protein [Teredinibacter turnerae]|uniref:cadherin-like beta sandwich domain-containing protein n=1 Tax=Teredinibacter turnerae TaxID=2426 RepID=UPI0005F84D5B|nr:cadherin-like beta sandwich domain-containing protein [Teredinibacter turnerae]
MLCRKTYLFVTLLLLSFLQACGSDSGRSKTPISDYENYHDLHLSSLTLSINGETVELMPAFTSERGGPYRIDVDETVNSITLQPVAMEAESVITISRKGILYEDGEPVRDSNGNFQMSSYGDETILASGETDTKNIYEGDNLIAVRVFSADKSSTFVYTIMVRRPSTEAKLTDLLVRDLAYSGTNSSQYYLTLDPAYDPDITEYSASAGYTSCTVGALVRTPDRNTQVTVNGAPLSNLSIRPVDLDVGANTLEIVSTPEVGAGIQTYTIEITRAAGTEAELAADANLAALTVEGGELTQSFNCLTRNYAALVNNGTASVTVTAAPAAPGATMRIGDPIYNASTGALVGVTEDEELVAGQAVSIDLEVGVDSKAIAVTSEDESAGRLYLINFNRLQTNRVYAENAAELQAALENAQPNDEIVLTGVIYEGGSIAFGESDETASFYSTASGTEDKPIYLRNAVSGYKPLITGEGSSTFVLSGDYWRLSNLEFDGGRDTLILDGANHNTMTGLIVRNADERGVHIRNGSSYNILQRSIIRDTGSLPRVGYEDYIEGLVVGTASEAWMSAPNGDSDKQDDFNIIAGNVFGQGIRGEAIDIKAGTTGTRVVHNAFFAEGTTALAEGGSFVLAQGNDIDIAYNRFVNESGSGLDTVVTLNKVDREWVGDSWGEDSATYQNIADFAGDEMTFVNSTDVINAWVGDNRRVDGLEVEYAGLGIDSSFTTPIVRIRLGSDNDLCLAESISAGANSGFLTSQSCSDDASQSWQLQSDDNGFVYISSAGENERIVQPQVLSYINQLAATPVLSAPRGAGNTASGNVYRWQVLYSQAGVMLANKGYSGTVVLEASDEVDGIALMQSFSGADGQTLLIEDF